MKALGRDERDADLLFRIYRFFRLKNVGDQRPFSSLQRAVEHEALVAQGATRACRTPRVRNVAPSVPTGCCWPTTPSKARRSTRSPSMTMTSWTRSGSRWPSSAGSASPIGDLRRANIFRGTDGELWIIDFGFSELAASDQLLRADVAELLAATAIVVGPERAVRAAVGALGKEPVGDSLAMLQPLAPGWRHPQGDGRAEGGLMAGLQTEVAQTGSRTSSSSRWPGAAPTVLILVSSLIALYVLIPQLSDVSGMVRQLRHASWGWVGATLLFSFLSYIGASISLMGLAPTHVPAFDAFEVCLSGSFVNRITPAGVGGIGLNVRYLQKRGADTAVAGVAHRREQPPRYRHPPR